MGQCWFRATKVNPLEKKEEQRDIYEMGANKSEPKSSNAGEKPSVESVSASVAPKVKPHVIQVKPSTNEEMSLRSLATNRPRKLPPLPSSITRKIPCVYRYQEWQTKAKTKTEWVEKELKNDANIVEVKPKLDEQANERVMKTLVQDVNGNITVIEVKECERKLAQDKCPEVTNESNQIECTEKKNISKQDGNTASNEKVLNKESGVNQPKCEMSMKLNKELLEMIPRSGSSEVLKNETLIKTKMAEKPNKAAKIAHLAVKSQIFGHLETSDDMSRKTFPQGTEIKEKERDIQSKKSGEDPYWKLHDIPVQPISLASKEDIQNEMKSIESEMHALLKPEEKHTKRYAAFTIGKVDKNTSQTLGCVPQRLLKHQKVEVDQEKMLEKQRDAERRRNANIAQRIKSAKRRSALKKPRVLLDREDNQDKNSQALKDRVFEKMQAAHARRNDFVVKRVQFAKMSSSLRKEPEDNSELENEIRKKVNFKIKAATERRNEILNKRADAAKKKGRTELVNEMEKKMVDIHKSKQEVKMNKIKENRERMLRKKLRSLAFQEKKRELARRQLARQKQEDEERCQTFFETETYDVDDDLGEHDWDFEDGHG